MAATSSARTSERDERDRVARELLLGGDRAPRREPLARERPAERGATAPSPSEREHRPVARYRRSRVGRPGRPGRPGAEQAKTRENDPGEQPEEKPAAQGPGSGRQGDAVAPAERVEVDDATTIAAPAGRSGRARSPSRGRPARRPRRSSPVLGGRLEALVERAEQLLRGGAELPSRVASRASAVSPNGGGGRSPPVVIVTAGIPAPTNGPCS